MPCSLCDGTYGHVQSCSLYTRDLLIRNLRITRDALYQSIQACQQCGPTRDPWAASSLDPLVRAYRDVVDILLAYNSQA